MRKPLIIIMSVIFTGALLVYTAQANLNLLQQIYVNPQYVIFGMLALEGGVLYWLGYYLLHWNGTHKAIALVMVVIDFALSMIGFFMDLNLHTGNDIKTALPPTLIVMCLDVIINVGVGLLIHFLPHGTEGASLAPPPHRQQLPQPKNEPEVQRYAQASASPRHWKGIKGIASSVWKGDNGQSASQDTIELQQLVEAYRASGDDIQMSFPDWLRKVQQNASSPLASPPLSGQHEAANQNGQK